ncbi:MAG: ABC transporter transmembrane domain-containing protein [Bacteroidia bacterium]|nr:ABC transporter transmembrane domain-containing protein [Bacteroidia bacterium]MDW8158146.1 ABC transporter transmembrane domain-containing protein [Bacteroidia bacterium]
MAKKNSSNFQDLPRVKINKQNLKHLQYFLTYLRPYRYKFIVGLIFLLFSSITSLAIPLVIGMLVDSALIQQNNASHFSFLPFFIPSAIVPSTPLSINQVAFLLVIILVLQSFFSFMRVYLFAEVSEKTIAQVRKDLYAQIIKLPIPFFNQRRVGELSSRIAADISLIQDTFTFTLAEMFRSILNLFVGISIIIFYSLKLTLAMLSTFPIIIIAALFFGRFIRKLSKQSQDKLAQANVIVEETLQGIQTVKAYANEAYEIKRYFHAIEEMIQLALKRAKFQGAFVSFIIFCLIGCIIFIIWLGANMVAAGEISMGKLTSFLILSSFVGAAFGSFGDQYAQIQKTLGATQRVRELLLEKTEPLQLIPLSSPPNPLQGSIQIQNLYFSYQEGIKPVLQNINLEIKPGEKIAIVGPSGAGKTTLFALLLGFYIPQQGIIYYDGKPLSEYPLGWLRQQIAVVHQDVFLFGGSIWENIVYGNLSATQAEVEAAAQKANAHEFIMQFPEGYQTIVGERGVKLSGGQRQRIAIARAILKNPKILLLDEATSSLDSESEYLVQEALQTLMQGRTTLIIAHRLATVRKADKIIVLNQGQIVESGTHEELLKAENGLYKLLASLQFTDLPALSIS